MECSLLATSAIRWNTVFRTPNVLAMTSSSCGAAVPVLGFTPEHNAYPYNFMIGSELQRRDAVDYLKLCLDMARELGSDYMLVSPAHAGYLAAYEEIWTRMVTTLRELTDHAEKVGVKLVVETLTPYESNAFKSANDLIELFKRIDSPYIVGMCDVVPPFVQHESIMAYIDKLGEKMYHMHITEPPVPAAGGLYHGIRQAAGDKRGDPQAGGYGSGPLHRFCGSGSHGPGGGGGVGTRIRGSGACGAEAAPIQTAFPSVG